MDEVDWTFCRTDFYTDVLFLFFSIVVGSAAYNLLMISALCIVAIKGPETRRIKLYSVFMVEKANISGDRPTHDRRSFFRFR